jgi:DNA-binding XRE family transcriptional regulator
VRWGVLVPKADHVKDRRATIRRERERIHQSVISVFRGVRQDHDLRQEDVGDLLGLSREVIVNMENDRRDIGVADLILFAEKMKEDPAALVARIVFYMRGKR